MGTYLVTGTQGFRGVPPGGTFTEKLDPGQEARAIARGAIAPVVDDTKKLSRQELNALAADAGVTDPEALPNKQAVVDAIDALA